MHESKISKSTGFLKGTKGKSKLLSGRKEGNEMTQTTQHKNEEEYMYIKESE